MKLILAAAPLGNPGDATFRLVKALEIVEIIAAEDSRRFKRLCQDLDITPAGKIVSFFEGNELERTNSLLNELKSGHDVLVITDAGMPTVNDPGYKLLRSALDSGINVEVLPGPSAVTTALALSGLATDRFCFEGFVPRTKVGREKFIENLKFEERTIILFEAANRLNETVEVMAQVLGGNRKVAICREMTKTFEETIRGTISEIQNWVASKEILGEITIVLEGAAVGSKEINQREIFELVSKLEIVGMDRKEAISAIAKEYDLPKREVFDAMVAAKSLE